MSEDAEPSAADMKRLIDQVRREHIKVLFFENALSPRHVQQIANETGAVVGGTLYSDALSKPGDPADPTSGYSSTTCGCYGRQCWPSDDVAHYRRFIRVVLKLRADLAR